ncbi:MAG: Spy/CpxP family protein refolding chaperone [Desulfomonilaceae bacterium]|nr:Spy/CpxP family protein refolding chaperone [Desulfomonilaceae bacterium]
MKRRSAVIATAVSLMVLVAAYAAYPGPRGWGAGPGAAGVQRGVWNDLSEEQQKQAESLRLEFFKKMETLRGELGKKRVEMMELAAKDAPDEEAIQKKREEIWALRDTMRQERRELGTKMRSLLTPEQRKKIGPYGFGAFPRGGYGPGGGCCFGGGNGFRGGGRFGGGNGFGGGCPWRVGGGAT